MEKRLTEYQTLFFERFLHQRKDENVGLMFGLCVGPKEYGFEEEMLDYLKAHPHATLEELEEFAEPFFPEIVEED